MILAFLCLFFCEKIKIFWKNKKMQFWWDKYHFSELAGKHQKSIFWTFFGVLASRSDMFLSIDNINLSISKIFIRKYGYFCLFNFLVRHFWQWFLGIFGRFRPQKWPNKIPKGEIYYKFLKFNVLWLKNGQKQKDWLKTLESVIFFRTCQYIHLLRLDPG